MATSRFLLAFAALALATAARADLQGPYRMAFSSFTSYDADSNVLNQANDGVLDAYDPLNPPTGPLAYGHEESFAYGSSTYGGTVAGTIDYGTMGLYARAVVQDQANAPARSETFVDTLFFDPLTIVGGSLGDDLRISLNLNANVEELGNEGGGIAWTEGASLYVEDPVDGWVPVLDQATTRTGGGSRDGIDETATTIVRGYDPSKRYALYGYASLTAIRYRSGQFGYADGSTTLDATHTARLTEIGFVRPDGALGGSFFGGSGAVYANPVPEPASLLALGAGLAFLRRRLPKAATPEDPVTR